MPSKPTIPLGIFSALRSTLLFKALEVNSEMGLFKSDVFSTFPRLMVVLSIKISPVKLFTEVTATVGSVGLLIRSL